MDRELARNQQEPSVAPATTAPQDSIPDDVSPYDVSGMASRPRQDSLPVPSREEIERCSPQQVHFNILGEAVAPPGGVPDTDMAQARHPGEQALEDPFGESNSWLTTDLQMSSSASFIGNHMSSSALLTGLL